MIVFNEKDFQQPTNTGLRWDIFEDATVNHPLMKPFKDLLEDYDYRFVYLFKAVQPSIDFEEPASDDYYIKVLAMARRKAGELVILRRSLAPFRDKSDHPPRAVIHTRQPIRKMILDIVWDLVKFSKDMPFLYDLFMLLKVADYRNFPPVFEYVESETQDILAKCFYGVDANVIANELQNLGLSPSMLLKCINKVGFGSVIGMLHDEHSVFHTVFKGAPEEVREAQARSSLRKLESVIDNVRAHIHPDSDNIDKSYVYVSLMTPLLQPEYTSLLQGMGLSGDFLRLQLSLHRHNLVIPKTSHAVERIQGLVKAHVDVICTVCNTYNKHMAKKPVKLTGKGDLVYSLPIVEVNSAAVFSSMVYLFDMKRAADFLPEDASKSQLRQFTRTFAEFYNKGVYDFSTDVAKVLAGLPFESTKKSPTPVCRYVTKADLTSLVRNVLFDEPNLRDYASISGARWTYHMSDHEILTSRRQRALFRKELVALRRTLTSVSKNNTGLLWKPIHEKTEWFWLAINVPEDRMPIINAVIRSNIAGEIRWIVGNAYDGWAIDQPMRLQGVGDITWGLKLPTEADIENLLRIELPIRLPSVFRPIHRAKSKAKTVIAVKEVEKPDIYRLIIEHNDIIPFDPADYSRDFGYLLRLFPTEERQLRMIDYIDWIYANAEKEEEEEEEREEGMIYVDSLTDYELKTIEDMNKRITKIESSDINLLRKYFRLLYLKDVRYKTEILQNLVGFIKDEYNEALADENTFVLFNSFVNHLKYYLQNILKDYAPVKAKEIIDAIETLHNLVLFICEERYWHLVWKLNDYKVEKLKKS